MAIIYTYPVKGTPLAADLVLISDTADGNKSKNATIASLVTSNAIDVVDTLNSLKGDVSITGGANITVTPSGQNIEISTSASNVDGSGTAGKYSVFEDSNTIGDGKISDIASGIEITGGLSLSDGTNNVTISIPTITTSYDLKMPASIGAANQVLKLPSTIGTSPYQLAWGDASGITTPISTANGGIGASTLSVVYNLLIGDGVSGVNNSFTQSGDSEAAIQLPVGPTNRRPTANAANVGLIRYNSTLTKFEGVAEGITDGSPDGTYSWVQFSVS
tara:strand:+ start:448 stop:1272 length:825 start_codon:yes stop_codon:yes gene_type:complete